MVVVHHREGAYDDPVLVRFLLDQVLANEIANRLGSVFVALSGDGLIKLGCNSRSSERPVRTKSAMFLPPLTL
jgi:hypothetical protein